MPVLPDGTIILDDAPNDDLHYGRHKEEWAPVVEEAPNDPGISYVRQNHEWVAAAIPTALPTVTEIVPAIANVGFVGNITAHVFGANFTATTEVLWDGTVHPTTFLTPNELTITVTPSLGVAPSVATITVQDAGIPGIGAAGFHFVSVTGVDYGTGLVLDATTTPPIVHLTPAGVAPPLLGGVYVPTRDATQAADVDTNGGDGRLVVLSATNTLLGGMLEPPLDGLPYERQWNETAQIWEWVPAAAGADFGTGLSYDETTTPPIVHLQPAGDSAATLGGVYVIDRERNVEEGLELGIDGRLRAPLATPRLAGTIVEPEDDGKGYVRTTLNGVSQWVPPADTPTEYGTGLSYDETAVPPIVHLQQATDFSLGGIFEPVQDGMAYSRQFDAVAQVWKWVPAMTAGLQITGLIPSQVVFGPTEPLVTVHAYGMEFTPTCILMLDGVDMATTFVSETELTFVLNPAVPIAEQSHIVTVKDPAAVPPALVDGLGAEEFKFIVPSIQVDYGTGLQFDTATTPPIVHLQVAGWYPQFLGGVYVPPPEESGLTIEADGRLTSLGVGEFGIGLVKDETAIPPIVHLQPAGDSPATLGGVYVIDRERNVEEGLELGIDGRLRVPLATDNLAGAIVEPPPDDKGYVRRRDLNGVSAWVPPSDTLTDFGTGLVKDETAVPPIVHLQPAADSPAGLGGVYVVDRERNVEEGLELGLDGRLRAPLATPRLAGTIVEPEDDGKGYVRTTLNGVSAWVPPADTPLPGFGTGLVLDETTPPGIVHLTPAGVAPQFLGGVYVPTRDATQAADVDTNGGDGRLVVLTATDVLLGGMLEPPKDGLPYERVWNETAQTWEWIQAAPGADFGTGLSVDDTQTPPLVHLQPAADSPAGLGGIYVVERTRTAFQGLELNGDGELKAPLATDLLAGTHTEPTPDGLAYSRQWDVTTSQWIWVPALTAGLQITGLIPNKAIIGDPILTVHAYGAEFTPTCVVMIDGVDASNTTYVSPTELTFEMNPAVPISPVTYIITVRDTATAEVGIGAESFEFIVSSTEVEYGTGLWLDTSLDPPLVNLQPAGDAANRLGGVWVPRRDEQQGLELDTTNMTGELKVPLATPFLAGSIIEPPQDDKGYVRRTDINTGIGAWVPPASQSSVTISDTAPLNPVHEDLWWESDSGVMFIYYDDGTSAQWVEASPSIPGSGVTISDTPPANPAHEDLWWESDSGKMFIYYDDGTSAQWVEANQSAPATSYHFAIGLTHDDATGDVNLLPAGDSPATLGGVYVVDRVRTATSGLELDIDGQLRAPLATEIYAGTIVDPPPDDKPYVRKRDLAGVSSWVPSVGGVIISDTPPLNPTPGMGWWESDTGDLYIWYDDGSSAQWVQVNGVSPPPGVYVADDPPMQPTENQLWWDSNAGTLNLWYTDPDTSQWVQVSAPQIPGVPEAPIDGVPYARRDANWVATTSLAATPGDLKDGFQVNDHGGWIKLDGRAVSTLTVTQQSQAALLGFTVNLPDGVGAVALMNGSAMGAVSGNMAKTIALANLPAINVGNATVTINNYDFAAVNTNSAGAHRHNFRSNDPNDSTNYDTTVYERNTTDGDPDPIHNNHGWFNSNHTDRYRKDAPWAHQTAGAHTHSVDLPAHNHTSPAHTHALGGSGTPLDVTPKSISVNKFLFLGA